MNFLKTMADALRNFFKSIPVDSLLHFLTCYAIAVTIGMFNILLGVLVSFGIGILKEVYDYKHPDTHTCSSSDLLCDLLGCLVAIVTLTIFR